MIDEDDDNETLDATGFDEDQDASFAGGADLMEADEDMGVETMDAEDVYVQPEGKPDLNLIMDIPVTMQVVLGTAVMPVSNLVKLGRGAVVKLNTSIGDPVDLIVNGRIVARGEVVVLENEESRFGITLTEIVSPGSRPQRSKTAGA
jgi:flagellar motor switch protein FliN/FliY